MKVTEKDVIAPFVVLFVVNFVALLTWTLVDPLQWDRREIEGQTNQSYGGCHSGGNPVSVSMMCIVGVVNFSAFCFACYQAFRARDVSDEFSEHKSLGVALFSWVQLLLIGVPVLFLIDDDNPSARYFITAGLPFAVCMSMIILIHVPIFVQQRKVRRRLTTEHQSRDMQASGSYLSDSVHKSPSSRRFSLNDVGRTRVSGVGGDMQKAVDELKKSPFETLSSEFSVVMEGGSASGGDAVIHKHPTTATTQTSDASLPSGRPTTPSCGTTSEKTPSSPSRNDVENNALHWNAI